MKQIHNTSSCKIIFQSFYFVRLFAFFIIFYNISYNHIQPQHFGITNIFLGINDHSALDALQVFQLNDRVMPLNALYMHTNKIYYNQSIRLVTKHYTHQKKLPIQNTQSNAQNNKNIPHAKLNAIGIFFREKKRQNKKHLN